jgi:hypothetical protein
MKKYLFVIGLIGLNLFGCSEQPTLNAPEDSSIAKAEPDWVSLPAQVSDKGMSVMTFPSFKAGDYIDGEKGGKIKIDEKYEGPNGEVMVKAEIEFKKGAFEGVKYITMVLSTEFGSATFSPHAIFNEDAIYNAEFKGLDLSGMSEEKAKQIKFVYQALDGSYEYIDFSKVEVDVKEGKLKVKDAKLPHFSRYGFVN